MENIFIQKNHWRLILKMEKILLKLAKKKKLYIGNAPDTFLGGGIQKSKELVDKKIIGKINFGNAIFAFPWSSIISS